ncbi:TetR/AcrR family transcriptional regulator [Sphingobium sp.]|uniref:TetR/AcrR family transcriptional regulator n=1 Tax=Sphingobium sp. TaxID=1912891 RepID=UPI0028BD57C4|nr:TetR/AcrR family transcriptional regulator [Sphingobium sp.]
MGETKAPVAKQRVRRTQLERTAESDKRMLDAAMQLVHERGIHGTTLKEVGELAGYSRGLANFRFGSKEGLFSAMLTQYNQRWKQEANEFIGDRRGLEAFKGALHAVSHFVETEAQFMRSMHILYYETLASSELIQRRLAEQHQAYRKDIASMIEQGIADGVIRKNISADQIAVQFCSFVFGIVYQWLVSPDIDVKRATEDYSAAMCELLTNDKKGVKSKRN